MSYQLKNGKWMVGNLLNPLEAEECNEFFIREKAKIEKKIQKDLKKQYMALLKSPIADEELVEIPKDYKKFNYQFNT